MSSLVNLPHLSTFFPELPTKHGLARKEEAKRNGIRSFLLFFGQQRCVITSRSDFRKHLRGKRSKKDVYKFSKRLRRQQQVRNEQRAQAQGARAIVRLAGKSSCESVLPCADESGRERKNSESKTTPVEERNTTKKREHSEGNNEFCYFYPISFLSSAAVSTNHNRTLLARLGSPCYVAAYNQPPKHQNTAYIRKSFARQKLVVYRRSMGKHVSVPQPPNGAHLLLPSD